MDTDSEYNSSDGESSDEENPHELQEKARRLALALGQKWDAAVARKRLAINKDDLPGDRARRNTAELMADLRRLRQLSKKLEVTGKWRYLGDMLLSHGQTYIGDLVAMGAASIGPGRALAHRVNPVDGDQWVLVVDWVRA